MKIEIKARCKDYCGYEGCGYVWLNVGSYSQGTGFTENEASRIIECVNACDGMTDPQKQIEKLKFTLSRILTAHLTNNNGAVMGEATLCRHFEKMARDALTN